MSARTHSGAPSKTPDDEAGRVLLLSLGFAVVGLILTGTTTSAAAVHMDAKRLMNLAEAISHEASFAADPLSGLVLTSADVSRAASDALAGTPPTASPADVRIVVAHTPDGFTATVTLEARSHPPMLAWVTRSVTGGIPITATASSRISQP